MNATKWVAGLAILGVVLGTMAEFPQTEPTAVALTWAIAISVTMAYGGQALTEVRGLVT